MTFLMAQANFKPTFSCINTSTILKPSYYSSYTPAYEDGTDRVFRNVSIQNSDAGELPRRKKHRTLYFCLILAKLAFSWQIFIEILHIKFHRNLSSGSCVDTCGQMDRHEKVDRCFSSLCECALIVLDHFSFHTDQWHWPYYMHLCAYELCILLHMQFLSHFTLVCNSAP
jgi:hypothetical protein